MLRLATEHVWDAFVIYSLLDDKQRNGEQLKVPHIGDQADRFTYAMEERNRNIILYGQPDSVTHACDKCLRVYETGGGEIRKSLQSTLNFPEVPTNGVSDCQATATQLWAMALVWAVHAVGSLDVVTISKATDIDFARNTMTSIRFVPSMIVTDKSRKRDLKHVQIQSTSRPKSRIKRKAHLYFSFHNAIATHNFPILLSLLILLKFNKPTVLIQTKWSGLKSIVMVI